MGDSQVKVYGNDFSIVLTVRVSTEVLTLESVPPVEFFVMCGGYGAHRNEGNHSGFVAVRWAKCHDNSTKLIRNILTP